MTVKELRFDGKVVLVTGAGNGLGYSYALAFAKRGAKVVVNDLGGAVDGSGSSARVADKVVEEIEKRGGIAVPDYHSVEDGASLVDTAIKAFGRIDIIVNNAGILRDRSFQKMTTGDWDSVQSVHLRSAFLITQAAWPYMKKQKFGRIIMTSSPAGLYGNFGQANYSAAKLGLVGLSNTLAVEGAKYNITCNAIAPTAGSRLSEHVMPEEFAKALKPEYITPLVLWLCHESCKETKGIFELGAGWVSKIRLQRSKGAILRSSINEDVTVEQVKGNWSMITDWKAAVNPTKIEESSGKLVEVVGRFKEMSALSPTQIEDDPSAPFNTELALSHTFQPTIFSVSPKDLALYAVGIGCDHTTCADELKYVYEGHEDFSAFPTFFVIPGQAGMAAVMGGIPGMRFNPMMLLHAEQAITFHNPLPISGPLKCQARIADIVDKGKGALVYVSVDVIDANGKLICTNVSSLFVRGKGGFGGKRSSSLAEQSISPPNTSPSAIYTQVVCKNQAAIYRLSGDLNPLHIDPNMAKAAGFQQPILHGLCSLGFGVRHVLHLFKIHASSVKRVYARFSAPVFPGEQLETAVWQVGQGRFLFSCRVVDRDVVAVKNAIITVATSPSLNPSVEETPSEIKTTKAARMFNFLANEVSEEMVSKANAVFVFRVKSHDKSTSTYTVDLKGGSGAVYEGTPKNNKKADCTVIITDDDLELLVLKKLDPMKAFIAGRLKVKGNMMLAQKLQIILKPLASKL
eukprot:m.103310 g.103310  ORF g.103310 m.103310 type:complete len:742 (-) comp9091_c0_seq2:2212-4437(-)